MWVIREMVELLKGIFTLPHEYRFLLLYLVIGCMCLGIAWGMVQGWFRREDDKQGMQFLAFCAVVLTAIRFWCYV